MVFSGRTIRSGNWTEPLSHYNKEGLLVAPGLVACHYVGMATITTTGANVFSIRDRADQEPVIPQGARIYRVQMTVPVGVAGTNGDLIKIAGAIGDAAGPDNLLSSAIASGAAIVETVRKDTIFPGNTTALAAPVTFKLFAAATGGTTAGSALTSAVAGGAKVCVEICYTMVTAGSTANPDYRAKLLVTKRGATSIDPNRIP